MSGTTKRWGRLVLGIAMLACLTAFMPTSAQAISYDLTVYTGSGTPPPPPYGTVTLTQNGANVDVTVTLASGEGFVSSGAGESLMFDLNPKTSYTVSGLTTGFSYHENLSGTGSHFDGTGNWNYWIACDAACGSGGSSPYTGTLSFTLNNATLASFIQNGNGNYFGVDICTNVTSGGCSAGITGDVVSTAASVPEPGSLALLGMAVFGLGLVRWRRNRA